MLTHDEQLQIGLEVLHRLEAETPTLSPPPYDPETELYTPPAAEPQTPSWQSPSLDSLIRQIGPQPPHTALIGLCEDGLPFMFDLSDPRPGSILISGDRGSGKTSLMQSILASISALNRPDEVSYYIITPRPSEIGAACQQANCLDILTPDERTASALVLDFAEVANQRRSGRERGPITILAIDDLATLDHFMDDKVTRYLEWLLDNGPREGMWAMTTLESERAKKIDRRLLPGFGTRLIGKIASPAAAGYLAGFSDPAFGQLESGRQFCTPFGSEWIRFWVPEIW